MMLAVSSLAYGESNDSLAIDSATVSVTPLRLHGDINIPKFANINKTALPFMIYVDMSEIINSALLTVPMNSGLYNGTNGFSLFGASPDQNQTFLNGCPVSDFSLLRGNLGYFSPELAENIEILTGSDAVIMSGNASGTLINIQQSVYNTRYPYTKLEYMQIGSNYLSLDGIFSQNIAKTLNIMFGFKTQSQNETYENTDFGSWNVRTGIRWNPDSLRSLSLVDNFSNNNIEYNGGINTNKYTGNLSDQIMSEPWFASAKDRTYRHDLSLSYSHTLQQLNSSLFSANIYFSNSTHEAVGDSLLFFFGRSTDTSITYNDYYFGGNISFLYNYSDKANIKSGIGFTDYFNEKSFFKPSNGGCMVSVFARPEIKLSAVTSLSGGISFTQFESDGYLAGGIKLKTQAGKYSAFVDFSYSETLQNDIINNLNFNKEKQIPIIAGFSYSSGSNSIELDAFYRLINNPVSMINTGGKEKTDINYICGKNDVQIAGASLMFKSEFLKHFTCSLKNTSNIFISDEKTNQLPLFLATVDLNYSRTIGRSEFKIGINGTLLSKYKPATFIPFTQSYLVSNQNETNLNYDGFNIYGVARLGTAFVKAGLYNILDREYRYLNYYPMPGRTFRLSVSWNFFN